MLSTAKIGEVREIDSTDEPQVLRLVDESGLVSYVVAPAIKRLSKDNSLSPLTKIEPEAMAVPWLTEALLERMQADLERMREKAERHPTWARLISKVADMESLIGEHEVAAAGYLKAYENTRDDEDLYRYAIESIVAQRVSDAREAMEALRSRGHAESALYIAQEYLLNGQRDRARQEVDSILEREPDNWKAAFLVGYIDIIEGKLVEAQRSLKRVLRIKNNVPNARYLSALCHYLTGNPAHALRDLRVTLGLNPMHSSAVLAFADLAIKVKDDLSGPEDALRFYVDHIASSDLRVPAQRLAEIYRITDRQRDGIEELNKIAEISPDESTLNNLAILYWEAGNKRAAVRQWVRAYEKKSSARESLINVVVNLTSALVQEENLAGAREIAEAYLKDVKLEEVVRGYPSAELPVLLTQIYFREDRSESAYRLANTIRKCHDANKEAIVQIDSMLGWQYTMEDVDRNRALEVTREGYEIGKQFPTIVKRRTFERAANNYAVSLLELGDTAEAGRILQEISEAQRDEHVLATRGLYHLRMGHADLGTELYEVAISTAISKNMKRLLRQKLHLELGRYLMASGDKRRAKRQFGKVMRIGKVGPNRPLDVFIREAAEAVSKHKR